MLPCSVPRCTRGPAADLGHARRRGLLRLRLPGESASRRRLRGARRSTPAYASCFLHALNPYGFSHLRRTNEDNVDLNRNFRDFSTLPPPNAAYAEVHGFMVPATWPPSPENEGSVWRPTSTSVASARCRRR